MLSQVHWLGHAGIKITGSRVIYVDPYQIRTPEPADLILITHDHYDHYSPDDIERIRKKETVIVAPFLIPGKNGPRVETIAVGEQIEIEGVIVQAVSSYNIGKRFHPQQKGNVGYVFRSDDVTYYHAGDTDYIPEMKAIRADVVFLPVGGTYTMNPQEAAKAASDIGPRVAVPIHWGSVVGSRDDADLFARICKACQVQILSPE